MPDTDIEELTETTFPVEPRKTINKLIKWTKKKWTVAFNREGKNEVIMSGEKVVINLGVITVDMCKNGQPRQAKLVGNLNPPPSV